MQHRELLFLLKRAGGNLMAPLRTSLFAITQHNISLTDQALFAC